MIRHLECLNTFITACVVRCYHVFTQRSNIFQKHWKHLVSNTRSKQRRYLSICMCVNMTSLLEHSTQQLIDGDNSCLNAVSSLPGNHTIIGPFHSVCVCPATHRMDKSVCLPHMNMPRYFSHAPTRTCCKSVTIHCSFIDNQA